MTPERISLIGRNKVCRAVIKSVGLQSNGFRFRYTGQQLLSGLDLYYYKARVYSPKLGRFLQTDPIGYVDDMNLYAYVGADPVNATDPTGKFLINSVGGLISAGAGAAVNYLTGQDVTITNLAVDFTAGFVGAGIVSNFNKLSTLAGSVANVTLAPVTYVGTGVANNTANLVDNNEQLTYEGMTNGLMVEGAVISTIFTGAPGSNVGADIADNAPAIVANKYEQAAVEVGFQAPINAATGYVQSGVTQAVNSQGATVPDK